MVATVLKFITDAQPLPDQPAATQPRPAVAASALLDDLRTAADASLQLLLEQMFRGADDVLQTMGERAADAEERRRYIETMRLLHMESGAIARHFVHDVLAQFNPLSRPARPQASADELHADQLEEQVTVINLASRIKHLHAVPLADLQQRLGHAARNAGLALSPQALSAKGICTAFARSLRELDIESRSRMVLYQVFDRLAVAALGPVYAGALTVLARYGIGAALVSDHLPAEPADALPTPSAETIRCLQQAADATQTADLAEALLARELLAIVRGKIVAGGLAVMQRIAIAGYWADAALLRSPSDRARCQRIEALRYAAIRCALTDSSFLADAAHPLRLQLQAASADADAAPVPVNGTGESALAALRMIEPLQASKVAACLRQSGIQTRS